QVAFRALAMEGGSLAPLDSAASLSIRRPNDEIKKEQDDFDDYPQRSRAVAAAAVTRDLIYEPAEVKKEEEDDGYGDFGQEPAIITTTGLEDSSSTLESRHDVRDESTEQVAGDNVLPADTVFVTPDGMAWQLCQCANCVNRWLFLGTTQAATGEHAKSAANELGPSCESANEVKKEEMTEVSNCCHSSRTEYKRAGATFLTPDGTEWVVCQCEGCSSGQECVADTSAVPPVAKRRRSITVTTVASDSPQVTKPYGRRGRLSTSDEAAAQAGLPLSAKELAGLELPEFNLLLVTLPEVQQRAARKIRRRVMNTRAAQQCRMRKQIKEKSKEN
ncbi:hypothetical protein PFISCL1PPCAC_4387, partial [Pristionchus fissidentatus]